MTLPQPPRCKVFWTKMKIGTCLKLVRCSYKIIDVWVNNNLHKGLNVERYIVAKHATYLELGKDPLTKYGSRLDKPVSTEIIADTEQGFTLRYKDGAELEYVYVSH